MALIDKKGKIVAVNQPWLTEPHSGGEQGNLDVGFDYSKVSEREPNDKPHGFAEFMSGIEAVLGGNLAEFSQEYFCQSSNAQHWYMGRIARCGIAGPVRFLITHEDISEQLHLTALQEINATIASTLDLSLVLSELLERISRLFPDTAVAARLLNHQTWKLDLKASWNIEQLSWGQNSAPLEHGLGNVLAQSPLPNQRMSDVVENGDFIPYLDIPLIFSYEFLGILSLYTKNLELFSREDVHFLKALAAPTAVAIHNTRLFDELQLERNQTQECQQRFATIAAIAHTFNSPKEQNVVFEEVLEGISDIFHFDATRLFLLKSKQRKLFLKATAGSKPKATTGTHSFRFGEGAIGTAVLTGEPVIHGNTSNTFLAVFPIRTNSEIVGCIECINERPRDLSPNDLELIQTIMDQIATAVSTTDISSTNFG